MNFIETARFKKAYRVLPDEAKERLKKALSMLGSNIRYPSLQAKKIKGARDIWEARVSLDYRITFQIVSDCLILRNVGHHDPTLKRP